MVQIRNVAIVGAGGNVGKHITQALLDTGRFTVTAISRTTSNTQFSNNVVVKRIEYAQPEKIVEALRGQDVLIITLSGRSPYQEYQEILIRAAAKAGVHWIMPNEWSPDSTHPELIKDVFLFGEKAKNRILIEDVGLRYISVCTGFWYEYSLSIRKCYGFDFKNREVQFYDNGETKISTSTWPQVGRAVACILSADLTSFEKVVYMSSFTVNQKDMLASACRILNLQESDWKVTRKTSEEMYVQGMKDMEQKNWNGTGNFLYGRVFYPDGAGDFSDKGLINDILDLPEEDLDEATSRAIKMQLTAS